MVYALESSKYNEEGDLHVGVLSGCRLYRVGLSQVLDFEKLTRKPTRKKIGLSGSGVYRVGYVWLSGYKINPSLELFETFFLFLIVV